MLSSGQFCVHLRWREGEKRTALVQPQKCVHRKKPSVHMYEGLKRRCSDYSLLLNRKDVSKASHIEDLKHLVVGVEQNHAATALISELLGAHKHA